jgi:hypothetical protein
MRSMVEGASPDPPVKRGRGTMRSMVEGGLCEAGGGDPPQPERIASLPIGPARILLISRIAIVVGSLRADSINRRVSEASRDFLDGWMKACLGLVDSHSG